MADMKPLMFLVMFVIAVGAIVINQFGLAALGNTDAGVNLSGTQYQAPYNNSVNTSVASFETTQFVPMTIGIVALASMLLVFAKIKYS